MNQKDLRILKLHDKGMPEGSIARKLGYGDTNIEEGIQRVRDAIKRHKPEAPPINAQLGVEDTPPGSVFLS